MKLAYLDCIGGIAGDMTLAALMEAGVSEAELLDALRTLPLSGWQWRSERVEIEAIYARRVFITHEEEQPHRHLSDVLEIIERGDLPPKVKQDAAAVFTR
ncbi:MAG: nickel insertion protein, partial [Fimbriimonadales bacterium]